MFNYKSVMRFFFIIILSFVLPGLCQSQNTRLLGEVNISFKNETLKGDWYLTNIKPENSEVNFMMNSDLEVKGVDISGAKTIFRKVGAKCNDCEIYRVKLPKDFTSNDTIHIRTAGSFTSFGEGANTRDYKGKIANNYGILRASEQSKWYPILLSTPFKESFLRKHAYQYEITAECDCGSVFIGKKQPKESGSIFYSEDPMKDIILI